MKFATGTTASGHKYPIVPDGLDYIGRRQCGCIVAWASLNGHTAGEMAKLVADWLRRGYSVERMETEETRKQLTTGCPHVSVAKAAPSLFDAPNPESAVQDTPTSVGSVKGVSQK